MKRIARLRWFVMSVLLAGVLMPLTGCNTMKGAGRDIERGGENLQDAAEDAKH